MQRYKRLLYLRNPQGNRKRGRPRNSWRRSVIKEVGRRWNELRFLAADRQKWKGLRQTMFIEGTMDSTIILLFLYMFRALLCSSLGGHNCIIQHLVSSHSVGGRQPCSPLPTCTPDGHLQCVMIPYAV